MPQQLQPQLQSEIDHRKAVISLRWLVIILASYLTLFSYLGTGTFPIVFAFALAFSASNVALMFVPRRNFGERYIQQSVTFLDLIFVCSTLYFLRVTETYLYIAFLGVFVLAMVWRD